MRWTSVGTSGWDEKTSMETGAQGQVRWAGGGEENRARARAREEEPRDSCAIFARSEKSSEHDHGSVKNHDSASQGLISRKMMRAPCFSSTRRQNRVKSAYSFGEMRQGPSSISLEIFTPPGIG